MALEGMASTRLPLLYIYHLPNLRPNDDHRKNRPVALRWSELYPDLSNRQKNMEQPGWLHRRNDNRTISYAI